MDEKMIKSPKHYTEGRKFEPKDVIRDWGLGFNLGSAVKYLSRAGRKEDIVQDLKKAQEFIQFEIEALEAESIHLCNSCAYECIAGCPAEESDITFGDGRGGDNIVRCEAYLKKVEAPKHPNCKYIDPIVMAVESFRSVMDAIMQDEICSVKPIVVKMPEGGNVEEIIEKIRKGLADVKLQPVEPTATEFQKKAMSLYNAYLYKLDKIGKDLKDANSTGAKDVGCVFSPTVVLKEGFDPEEVLEGLTKKIMEGR